jgi:hypothetical protein
MPLFELMEAFRYIRALKSIPEEVIEDSRHKERGKGRDIIMVKVDNQISRIHKDNISHINE